MPVEPPVVSPRSLAEAYALLASAPHRPLAGGTDLLVQLAGELGPVPDRVLDLWRLDELRGIRVAGGALEIGALTTHAQLRRSEACAAHAPTLVAAAATIGAAQVQNRGTLGGNVMNASPAGDTLPVLLALDAVLVAGGPRGQRQVPAAAFWPSYRTTALRPDELLLGVRIPIVDGRRQAFRKVGTRRAQAISKVVLAASWRRDPTWRDVRIAFGSVAATPVRATAAEAALEGASAGPEAIDRAVAALLGELHPIDDVRSTAAYRLEVSGRILRRLLEDAS
ncbi:MAG: xanthine dehydrogenase family protein subunit M [Chloroflexota bacterium]